MNTLQDPMFEDIHYKYPLAFKMAEIAARVIGEEAGVAARHRQELWVSGSLFWGVP